MNKKSTLIHINETDSTNHYLQSLMQNEVVEDETIVLSDFQNAGRGQIGNVWESEVCKNLTFSILYKPKEVPANKPFIISEISALSVKMLLDLYVTDISVKWPNDIYWKDKKICGILIENTLSDGFIKNSILGIGININQEKFNSDAPNPVSLTQITGQTYDIVEILEKWHEIFGQLRYIFETYGAEIVHDEYLKSLYRRGGYHKYSDNNGIFEAKIKDIEQSGHLILERIDGSNSRYAFKEVKFIIDE